MTDIADFGTAVFTALLNNSQLLAGAAQADSALGSIGKNVGKVGSKLTTGVTLPILAIGAAGVATAKRLDSAWAEVLATYNTPIPNASMKDQQKFIQDLIKPTGVLGAAVTDLSMKYGLNRAAVVDNMGTLSQMGYTMTSAVKITDVLSAGMDFAVATGIDLADGLGAVVAIQKTFSLTMADTNKVLRQLNSVENDTAASGEDLEVGLRRAGGAAQQLVGPMFSSQQAIATVAAGMAVLKERHQETMRSGDALRAMFQRLYVVVPKVVPLWKKMGVDAADAQGNLKPFPQLMGEIAKNWDKLSQREQIQFGKSQIGIEFGPLFAMLIDDQKKAAAGQSTFNKALALFQDEAGGAVKFQTEIAVRSSTLGVAIGRVKAAWDLMIDAARPLIKDILIPITDWFSRLLVKFSMASPHTKKLVIIIAALAAALGPVLLIIAGLVGVLGAVFSPIGLVIAAIAALVAIFILLWKNTGSAGKQFRAIIGGTFKWLKSLIPGVVKAFHAVVNAVKAFLPYLEAFGKVFWNNIKPAIHSLQNAFKNIMVTMQKLMPAFKMLAIIAGGVVLVAITALGVAIRVIAKVIEMVVESVTTAVNIIVDVFKFLWNVLFGNSIIPDIVEGFRVAFEVIRTIIVTVVTFIVNFIRVYFEIVKAIFTAVFTAIRFIVTTVWNGVLKPIFIAIALAFRILGAAVQWVWEHVIKPAWTALRDAISWAWHHVIKPVFDTLGKALKVVGAAFGILKEAIGKAWDWIGDKIKTVVDFAIGLIDKLLAKFSKLKDDIAAALPGYGKLSKEEEAEYQASVKTRQDRERANRNPTMAKKPGEQSRGGLIPGTGNKDSFPAMLMPGEFVVRKTAVRRIGLASLNQLNMVRSRGDMPFDPEGSVRVAAPDMKFPRDLARIIRMRDRVPDLHGVRDTVKPTFPNPEEDRKDRSVSLTVNYPEPEPTSEALPRVMRNLEFLGAFG